MDHSMHGGGHNMAAAAPEMSPTDKPPMSTTTMDHRMHNMRTQASTSDNGNMMSMMAHSMPMVFNADFSGFKVLFAVWEVEDPWQFFVSVFAIFVVALLYELLRIHKHNHFIRDCKSRKKFMCFGGAASLTTSPRPTVTQEAGNCCHANDLEPEVAIVKSEPAAGSCCQSKAANGTGESTVVLLNNSNSTPTKSIAIASQRRSCATTKPPAMFSQVHLLQTLMHIVLSALGFLLMLAVMTFNVWIFLAVVLGVGFGYFLSGHLLESPVDSNSCCI